jgi:hypothetical protein
MELVGTQEELQKVADYRTMKKMLRPGGIGSIIFGGIAFVMGIISIEDNPLNMFLVLLGIFLFIEGAWLVSSPSPSGIIVDGIALVILGIWNIFITIYNESQGAKGSTNFALIGILQIIWGIQSFKRYKRFSNVTTEKPPEESIQRIDEIVKNVLNAKPDFDLDVIQFSTKNQNWKGKLLPEVGVFVETNGNDVVFVRKELFNVTQYVPNQSGEILKVNFQFDDQEKKGTIPSKSLLKFEAWKNGTPLEYAVPAVSIPMTPSVSKSTKLKRILIIILAIILLFIIGLILKN